MYLVCVMKRKNGIKRVFRAFGGMIFFCTASNLALMPKKLPNGKSRTFLPNLDNPRNDLQAISAGTANLISKNWMQNILLDVITRRHNIEMNEDSEFIYNDIHIMSGIHELQSDIEQTQKKTSNTWTDVLNVGDNHASPFLYLAWKPRNVQGINEVLFIVVAIISKEIDSESQTFYLDIKNVIQSPFWDEQQIPSIFLKQALIDQNQWTNETTLRFDTLYQNNLRYKLAWETWYQ